MQSFLVAYQNLQVLQPKPPTLVHCCSLWNLFGLLSQIKFHHLLEYIWLDASCYSCLCLWLLMFVAGLMICAIVTYQLSLNPLPGPAAALLSLQMNCPRETIFVNVSPRQFQHNKNNKEAADNLLTLAGMHLHSSNLHTSRQW